MGVLRETVLVLDPVVRSLTALLLLPQHANANPAPHVRLRIVSAAAETASDRLGLGGGLPVEEEDLGGGEVRWVVPREVERSAGHLGLSKAGLVLLARCLEAARGDLEASESSDSGTRVGRRGRKGKRGTSSVDAVASRFSPADLAVAHAIASLFAQQAERRLRDLEHADAERVAAEARAAIAAPGAATAAAAEAWFGDSKPKASGASSSSSKSSATATSAAAAATAATAAPAKSVAAVLLGPGVEDAGSAFPRMAGASAAGGGGGGGGGKKGGKGGGGGGRVANAWTGATAEKPSDMSRAIAASNAPTGRRLDRRAEDDDDLVWKKAAPASKRS
jgi:hypothetical protein